MNRSLTLTAALCFAGTAAAEELSSFLVRALPPDSFRTVDWGYLSADPTVKWLTEGIERRRSTSYRAGVADLTVGGESPRILRRGWQNLYWTIQLQTTGNPTFGPRAILIRPGGDGKDACFGVTARGCTFTPEQALASPRLKIVKVCETGMFSDKTIAYSVSATGKEPSLVAFTTSGGSGGSSSWLEIRPLADKPEGC